MGDSAAPIPRRERPLHMKGIILAGGSGTRMRPLTEVVSKQLLPVYDKPLIFYPLSTLMLAGVREILIICSPQHLHQFRNLLGDGSHLGIKLEYKIQQEPKGIAEALLLGEEFVGNNQTALILGDNLFFGTGLGRNLASLAGFSGAVIMATNVSNPSDFGVVEFDDNDAAISLEEKPVIPKSNWIVPGLYFYDSSAFERAKSIRPSERGELEITDVNLSYFEEGLLKVNKLPRGTAWFDSGTPDSLLDAAEFVRVTQQRQGLLIGSPEEVSWRQGWMSEDEVIEASRKYKSAYGSIVRKSVQGR